MAFEYKYNFKNDLNGTGIDELISGLCEDRFNKK